MQFKSVGCVLFLRSEPVGELGTPAKRFDGEICLGSAPTLRAISIYRQIGKADTFRMCCLRVVLTKVLLDAGAGYAHGLHGLMRPVSELLLHPAI